jgi:hypothetical protein
VGGRSEDATVVAMTSLWSRLPSMAELGHCRDVTPPRVSACHTFLVRIICVEFEKGRTTAKEARRALGEMVPKVGAKHAEEVERALRKGSGAGPVVPMTRLRPTNRPPRWLTIQGTPCGRRGM